MTGQVLVPQCGGCGAGFLLTSCSGVMQEKTGTSAVLQTSEVPVQREEGYVNLIPMYVQ